MVVDIILVIYVYIFFNLGNYIKYLLSSALCNFNFLLGVLALGTIVDLTKFLNLPMVGSMSSGLIISTSSLKDTFLFCFFVTPNGIACVRLVPVAG